MMRDLRWAGMIVLGGWALARLAMIMHPLIERAIQ